MSNSAKVVCHVTSVHPPGDPRIFHKQCRTLSEAGYRVVLVAPHARAEQRDGVEIVPIPAYRRYFARWLLTVPRAFWAARRQRAAVYHLHDPELIPVGLLLKLTTWARVVYDMHEYYSESLAARARPRLVRWVVRWLGRAALEGLSLKLLDAVVFPTESLRELFPKVPRGTTLRNLANRPKRPANGDAPAPAKRYDVVFVGSLSHERLRFMMAVAAALAEKRSAFTWLFVGLTDGCRDWLHRRYDRGFLDAHIHAVGRVPYETVMRMLASCRVGFNYHPRNKHRLVAIPMKVFEYMAAGLPVVSTALPELTRLLVNREHGVLVDSDDPSAYAEAVASLLDDESLAEAIGRAGRQHIATTLNWEDQEAPKLLALYQDLIGESNRGLRG